MSSLIRRRRESTGSLLNFEGNWRQERSHRGGPQSGGPPANESNRWYEQLAISKAFITLAPRTTLLLLYARHLISLLMSRR